MSRLRLLCLVAPLTCACSLINAPAEIDPGTGGTGGAGATGGAGGTGGMTTTTDTTPPDVCGDGKRASAEQCDDGGVEPGDGCDASCMVEAGYNCEGDVGATSTCTLLCGNGTVDGGEECDDSGATDMDPPAGNQDYCSETCTFQEFDIESGADNSGVVHQNPVIGYRRDADVPSFLALWSAQNADKLLSREYKFDGAFKKALFTDMATSPTPDEVGHLVCTAATNRSLVIWRDAGQAKVFTRKIESDGTLFSATEIVYPTTPEALPSCGTSASDTFVVATMAKSSGPLYDVWVQSYASSALAMGTPVDVGDATAPNATATWGTGAGFLVAWVADPASNGNISAQLLKESGEPDAGFIFQLSDVADIAPREPAGARIGMMGQFAFAYTREIPAGGQREVVLRIFQSPGSGSAPIVVATGNTDQREPTIAVNPTNGKLVVAWTALANGGENIFYRVFNSMGMPLTEELVANQVLTGKQTRPSIAVDPPTGDTAIVWDNFVPNSVKPHKSSARILKGLLQ